MFTGICCIFLHFSSVGYCVYPKVYGFLVFLPIFVKNFIVTCNLLFSGKKTGAKICLISTPGFRNTHITTKGDKNEHGLGLRIVENIINRHSGQMIIDDKENYFRIKVLLYNIGK